MREAAARQRLRRRLEILTPQTASRRTSARDSRPTCSARKPTTAARAPGQDLLIGQSPGTRGEALGGPRHTPVRGRGRLSAAAVSSAQGRSPQAVVEEIADVFEEERRHRRTPVLIGDVPAQAEQVRRAGYGCVEQVALGVRAHRSARRDAIRKLRRLLGALVLTEQRGRCAPGRERPPPAARRETARGRAARAGQVDRAPRRPPRAHARRSGNPLASELEPRARRRLRDRSSAPGAQARRAPPAPCARRRARVPSSSWLGIGQGPHSCAGGAGGTGGRSSRGRPVDELARAGRRRGSWSTRFDRPVALLPQRPAPRRRRRSRCGGHRARARSASSGCSSTPGARSHASRSPSSPGGERSAGRRRGATHRRSPTSARPVAVSARRTRRSSAWGMPAAPSTSATSSPASSGCRSTRAISSAGMPSRAAGRSARPRARA